MLSVSETNCSSATFLFNSSDSNTTPYNVTCTATDEDPVMPTHSVTLLNVMIANITEFVVQPLLAETNYSCSLKQNNNNNNDVANLSILTLSKCETPCGHLSPTIAGVIGSIVGVVVTLLLIAGITVTTVGVLILVRRKK